MVLEIHRRFISIITNFSQRKRFKKEVVEVTMILKKIKRKYFSNCFKNLKIKIIMFLLITLPASLVNVGSTISVITLNPANLIAFSSSQHIHVKMLLIRRNFWTFSILTDQTSRDMMKKKNLKRLKDVFSVKIAGKT